MENVKMKWRKTKKEIEIKVKKEKTDHKLPVVKGVQFWWHHEERKNHIDDKLGPPKRFKK
jgi:hypothetical protein